MLQRREVDIRDDAKQAVPSPHAMLAAAIDRIVEPKLKKPSSEQWQRFL
jgi:hypothetical protein